jgi:DNA-binding transcriptional regulator Cro
MASETKIIAYLFNSLLSHNISALMYNANMDKNRLIFLAGSQVELAKLLGISQAAVSQWKKVPQQRIWQLQLLKPSWFA